MRRTSPNTALQRTRSAPLRSPLSFQTLGGKLLISILATATVTGLVSAASPPAARKWKPIEFHLAESQEAPGLIPAQVPGADSEIFLHPRIELDDRDLDGAEAGKGQFGSPVIRVHLTKAGAKKMRALCDKYQRHSLAILANGKVISVPRIHGSMTDRTLEITGYLPEEDLARLTQLFEAH